MLGAVLWAVVEAVGRGLAARTDLQRAAEMMAPVELAEGADFMRATVQIAAVSTLSVDEAAWLLTTYTERRPGTWRKYAPWIVWQLAQGRTVEQVRYEGATP